MSEVVNKLETWGCDIKAAMERFLDDEELYEECLQTFKEDPGFAELGKLLETKDYKQAFDCVHTLKGVSANLGINPLWNALSDMTEELRADKYDKLDDLYTVIQDCYSKFCEIVG
ncbi:MAG: Hpt domain-containing protein [Lachnospiraceae bacterium]|nr:Hpt domain-containing protein [Lachnospiraceae bacterium]MDD3614689.1 Hpt domain-containing protein [Lachnospiraceae bacterium]